MTARPLRLATDAVIFDMDGVITHTMPDHYRAWKEVLAGHGIPVKRREIYLREGQKGSTFLEELFEGLGRPYDAALARRILREKEQCFKKIVRRRLVRGAARFLEHLRQRDFRLGLVTGTSRHEVERIFPHNLARHFEEMVTADDVRHGKPRPDPYRRALQKMKFRPKQAVVIENAPLGIRSARAAGLRCLALETSLPREHLAEADGVYKSIAELREKVEFVGCGL